MTRGWSNSFSWIDSCIVDGKAINAELALIRSYEDAFNRIKEVTGGDDVNVIVKDFIRDEEENFALFNYVNELNSEMETLNDQVCQILSNLQSILFDNLY